MKVLGLDLSLKGTGICVLDGDPSDPTPVMRTELVPQPEAKTVEARVLRLVAITERIVQLINGEQPDHIIIEAAAKNQVWQAAAIGEIHGVVKVQIYLACGKFPMVKEASEMRKVVVGKIERVMVSTTDEKGKVKKRASYGEIPGARKGKSKRATVKDVIEGRLAARGLKFPTQDEMDAYVAAKYCWGKVTASPTGASDDLQKAKIRRT
jgi:Holliday junction resolvasome RuvABC endonuclease subunit